MKLKTLVVTGALALVLASAPAAAKTFRYAFQGDLNALDPYTLNETFASGALGNVMEGLTKRDKDLKIIPGLAERDRRRSSGPEHGLAGQECGETDRLAGQQRTGGR